MLYLLTGYYLSKWRVLIFVLFHIKGLPGSSAGKEPACNTGDPSSIPLLGRSTGEGIGYLLQYSWASLVAQLAKNLPAMQDTWVWSLGWEGYPKEVNGLPTQVNSYPLRYSGLENSMDCIVHGVAKCQTGGQATFTFTVDQGNLCFHYSLFANEIF